MKIHVNETRHLGFLLPLVVFLASVSVASATMVEYTGQVTIRGRPVQNAFVIAGTFDPGFDPTTYGCFYGIGGCNMDSTRYSQAITDGNFRPIGNGTHTTASGDFAGSGNASDISGSSIYLFVFKDGRESGPSDPDLAKFFALATSTEMSWIAGDINVIDGSDANRFVFGGNNEGSIDLTSQKFSPPLI